MRLFYLDAQTAKEKTLLVKQKREEEKIKAEQNTFSIYETSIAEKIMHTSDSGNFDVLLTDIPEKDLLDVYRCLQRRGFNVDIDIKNVILRVSWF